MSETQLASYTGDGLAMFVERAPAGSERVLSGPVDQETVVILLEGALTFPSFDARATRTNVFEQRATALYFPPGTHTIAVADEDTEYAVVHTTGAAVAPAGDEVVVVTPDDVVVHTRGTPPWRREVHDIVDERVPAQRLLVGETFNEPGQWSSFPPHKHDGGDGEPALEEAYYYRFDRPGGFGFQGLYEADGTERAEFLRHGSIVGIPRGYHPVCAAPGYRLYYLWALVGAPRRLAMYEDPAHRWLAVEHQ